MNFVQLHANLGRDAPSKSTADGAGPEEVIPVIWIAQHDGKVLWYIIQKNMERGCIPEISFRMQDTIVEDHLSLVQPKVMWIAGTKEL